MIETPAHAFATRRKARQAQASTRRTDRHLAGFTLVQRYDVEIAVTLPYECKYAAKGEFPIINKAKLRAELS